MSKEIGFIYPQWLQARNALAEAIINRKEFTDHAIYKIVDTWMRCHVFEIGVTVEANHEDLYKHKEESEKHLRYMAARKIADELFDKELFMRQTVSNSNDPNRFPSRVFSYTVIAFGCPVAIGPGTRESAILKMQDKETP